MAKTKNIWIFGGTGFIGKELVTYLAGNPKFRLHLLLHKNFRYQDMESFNTFTGDLNRFDFSWFERYPPDVIFHLARLGGGNNITRYMASSRGARANERLVSLLTGLHKPPVVVYVSGSLMYGHQPGGKQADEYTELSPVSYARQYYRGEKPYIEAQERQLGDIRFARPGWIVGPGSWFMTFYWRPYLDTSRIPVYGDGSQLMSLVDLHDCAGQISDLAENGEKHQNLNIFTGSPVTQHEFAETLARLLHTTTIPVTLRQLKQHFGNTAAEAFGSSIPLKTLYPGTINRNKQKCTNLETILGNTLAFLKYN